MKQFVLIANRDTDKLNELKKALSADDIIVNLAVDGHDAYMKSTNQKYDLIITAYRLPKLEAAPLIKSFRDHRANAKTPILIITSEATEVENTLQSRSLNRNISIVPLTKDLNETISIAKKILENQDEVASTAETTSATTAPAPKALVADVNFLNPFISSIQKVIAEMASVKDITPKKVVVMKPNGDVEADIFSILSVQSSYFNGSLVLAFPKDTYFEIQFRMLGERSDTLNSESADMAGELGNIIFGAAKKIWNEMKYEVQKTIPSVIWGNKPSILLDKKNPTLLINFTSDAGRFCALINVSFDK